MVNTSQIREHMEVVANDGEHVGTVDHFDEADGIQLTKSDPAAGGQHHWIKADAVASVDDKVHLRCTADEARLSKRQA